VVVVVVVVVSYRRGGHLLVLHRLVVPRPSPGIMTPSPARHVGLGGSSIPVEGGEGGEEEL